MNCDKLIKTDYFYYDEKTTVLTTGYFNFWKKDIFFLFPTDFFDITCADIKPGFVTSSMNMLWKSNDGFLDEHKHSRDCLFVADMVHLSVYSTKEILSFINGKDYAKIVVDHTNKTAKLLQEWAKPDNHIECSYSHTCSVFNTISMNHRLEYAARTRE